MEIKIIILLLYWLSLVAISFAFSLNILISSKIFSFIISVTSFAVASILMAKL